MKWLLNIYRQWKVRKWQKMVRSNKAFRDEIIATVIQPGNGVDVNEWLNRRVYCEWLD